MQVAVYLAINRDPRIHLLLEDNGTTLFSTRQQLLHLTEIADSIMQQYRELLYSNTILYLLLWRLLPTLHSNYISSGLFDS